MKKGMFLLSTVVIGLTIGLSSCGNDTAVEKKQEAKQAKVVEKKEVKVEPSTTIKFYEASVIGMDDQYCTSRFLLSIKSNNVKAISVDCADEYGIFNYYEGNVVDNSISGNASFFDNCGGSDDSTPMCVRNDKFKFVISKDTNQITINGDIYKAKNLSISNSNFDLYETPSKTSKIIFKNKEKSSVKVLEIGNVERVDKLWKVWSKISVNGKTGWVLGGLSI